MGGLISVCVCETSINCWLLPAESGPLASLLVLLTHVWLREQQPYWLHAQSLWLDYRWGQRSPSPPGWRTWKSMAATGWMKGLGRAPMSTQRSSGPSWEKYSQSGPSSRHKIWKIQIFDVGSVSCCRFPETGLFSSQSGVINEAEDSWVAASLHTSRQLPIKFIYSS